MWKQTGPNVLMVSRDSATGATPEENQDDIFSIDANHSDIVKFKNNACPDYLNVRSRIIGLVQNAPGVISKRFEDLREGLCIIYRHSLSSSIKA